MYEFVWYLTIQSINTCSKTNGCFYGWCLQCTYLGGLFLNLGKYFSLYPEAAAAAAKLLQLCLTPCDPIDVSPLGSSVSGILQARILEWAAISLPISQKSGFIFKSQFIPRCSSCITVQKRVHKCHHTSVAVHLASSENPVVGESTWMPFPLYSSWRSPNKLVEVEYEKKDLKAICQG